MLEANLILPVENQVRELDAKLLLACITAQRGHRVILGWKGEIDQTIYRFKPGAMYLAKSFAPVNLRMLRLLKQLGHHILAWDEEGMVHYPPHVYVGRRFSEKVLDYIDGIIAWGHDNAQLLEQFITPFPRPIHILGNPRGDLLRPELKPYFSDTVKALQEKYGNYLLVNTNFPSVNSFDPTLNTCYPDPNEPSGLGLGLGSGGMPPEFARGRYTHLGRVLNYFQELLPKLAETYAAHTIILRPHPSEDQQLWKKEGQKYKNVVVEASGNVIPWILASAVLIHNGCTTAVEAFAMGKPVVSYEPIQSQDYDNHLPSDLSICCQSFNDLRTAIDCYLANPIPQPTEWQQQQFSIFLSSYEGPLASERIADLIDLMSKNTIDKPTSLSSRIRPFTEAVLRHTNKKFKQLTGTRRYSKEFQLQRFPEIDLANLEEKAQTFCRLLRLPKAVKLQPLQNTLFRITV